ncbi:MAG: hypothetical protein IPJ57_06600 [Gemmatimonadetes bacterium]|nr:hypothetical protein [Gemmatimonadota bacterium]MBK9067802.1 hypothetical protein [Gemmatimonadota bacterium]
MIGGAARRALLALLLPAGLAGQTQAPLAPLILTLPISVRSAGLGGASVALNGDASATFLNPAGLATIRNIAIEGAAQRYPDGSLEGFAAAGFRFLQFDFGGGIHYLRFSDSSAVVDNLQWTASAVYRVGLIAAGSTLRYVSLEDSTGDTRRTAALDAGLGIHVFDLMTLAFSVRNLESWRVTGGPLLLPVSKHAAFAFNFTDPQLTARVLGTVEVVWQARAARRTVIGVEAGAVLSGVGLVGRVGYGAPPEGSGQKEISLGAGLVLSRFNIDYAWQRRTRLGREVHRLGLRFTL